MNTPERLSALRTAKQTLRMRDQKISRMKQRLESLTTKKSVEVDSEVSQEIEDVIKEKSSEIEALPKSDFRRVFWDQQVHMLNLLLSSHCCIYQVKAIKVEEKGRNALASFVYSMVLKICRVSPKAYEVMKESGMCLPSRRTLNDYTHWVSAKPGFSHEVDVFLRTEAKVDELEDWQRYTILVIN